MTDLAPATELEAVREQLVKAKADQVELKELLDEAEEDLRREPTPVRQRQRNELRDQLELLELQIEQLKGAATETERASWQSELDELETIAKEGGLLEAAAAEQEVLAALQVVVEQLDAYGSIKLAARSQAISQGEPEACAWSALHQRPAVVRVVVGRTVDDSASASGDHRFGRSVFEPVLME